MTVNGGQARFTSSFELNGVATISSAGIAGFQNNPTLSGTGTVSFNDNGNNRLSIDGNTTLTLDTGIVLQGDTAFIGAAVISGGTGSLINNGAIRATGAGIVRVNQSGTLTNGGKLESVSGATLLIDQGFTQSGATSQTVANSIVRIGASGNLTETLNGGSLSGNGTLDGNVNNVAGLLTPGNSAGVLTIDGNYTQGTLAEMFIELGGTTQGTTFDFFHITGSASLAGNLRVDLINGFTPVFGQTFTFMNFASRTGMFDTMESDAAGYGY